MISPVVGFNGLTRHRLVRVARKLISGQINCV